eukprot:1024065-Prorocentrum_minimum.AAC.1
MGIFSLPFCGWCPPWVYSLSPSAIGARYGKRFDRCSRLETERAITNNTYGYILSPLPRLVPAA